MPINKTLLACFAILIASLLIYAVFYRAKDDETFVVYCGVNNTKPVTAFKNPTRAFPAFVNEYHASAKTAINLLDTLKSKAPGTISADVDYDTKMANLREKLDQDNIRMENILKASFFAFNANPCDDQIKQHYLALLDTMAAKTLELERFRASITHSTEKGGGSGSGIGIPRFIDTSAILTAVNRLGSEYNLQ